MNLLHLTNHIQLCLGFVPQSKDTVCLIVVSKLPIDCVHEVLGLYAL